MNRLNREFFERSPEVVAKDLLGKLLVRRISGKELVGKIVETEAYLGEGDKASHSHRGQTKRNAPMFGPAGHAYIYFTYGMHWLLNVVTEKEGKPSGVLIRAVEPVGASGSLADLKKLGSGPARLTKWLGVDGELNGIDVTKSGDLYIAVSEKIDPRKIVTAPRVGVGYAEEDTDRPLRFFINDSDFVTKH